MATPTSLIYFAFVFSIMSYFKTKFKHESYKSKINLRYCNRARSIGKLDISFEQTRVFVWGAEKFKYFFVLFAYQ
jgi:hypothetical protein